MNDDLRTTYPHRVRYDLVKFRWYTIDTALTIYVKELVGGAFEALQAKHPNLSLKKPNYTYLPPSPNKPNGMFLVELFGFAATCVEDLPSSWMKDLTYAHVKSFAVGMKLGDIKELQNALLDTSGRRQVVVTQGGSAGRSKKGVQMPSLRIGSRKSDLHFVLYARRGQVPGFESRWRDEGLLRRTLDVYDMMGQASVSDAAHWSALRYLLARDASDQMFVEFSQRGISLERYMDNWSDMPAPIDGQLVLDMEEDEVPTDWTPGDAY